MNKVKKKKKIFPLQVNISGLEFPQGVSGTSKSNVSSRILVASLEAWGSVAICLVHSDTVFVSLVVRGSAALISTSAASHTYAQHEHNQVGTKTLFKALYIIYS